MTTTTTKLLHTEGILEIQHRYNGQRVLSFRKVLPRGLCNGYVILVEEEKDDRNTEHIDRIVTCVNAMQGLSNEEVEGLREQNRKLKEDLQDLTERIEDAKYDAMERDEKRDM